MTQYNGHRHSRVGNQLVTKDGGILDPHPSQRIWNHSPTGFSWGYRGSGPAQLALALLYDVTGDEELSGRLHQQFKEEFVAGWGDIWGMTDIDIQRWVDSQRVAVPLSTIII